MEEKILENKNKRRTSDEKITLKGKKMTKISIIYDGYDFGDKYSDGRPFESPVICNLLLDNAITCFQNFSFMITNAKKENFDFSVPESTFSRGIQFSKYVQLAVEQFHLHKWNDNIDGIDKCEQLSKHLKLKIN